MTESLPDIATRGLDVIFCGINPGLSAAASGHHFVGHSNRFWRVLHLAGFTPHQLRAEEDRSILSYGYGLTTVAGRPTAGAADLSAMEIAADAEAFRQRIASYAPGYVAFLGKMAYAALSGTRDLAWGAQPGLLEGARVWVLPNPSGRNRAFSLNALVEAYRQLRDELHAADAPPDGHPQA